MKHQVQLGDVEETLLVPLYARAVESRRRRPILVDPRAVEMVDAIDWDFERFGQRLRTAGVALRTAMFDRYVRPFVERHPAGTVVEVGAGLNTRFERLDNGTIHWVDLDLPNGAALRRRYFQETDRRTILGCSILDPAWVDTVRQCPPPYCFVAETVLVYLQEAEVQTALGMISANFPGSRLVFDTLGPRAVRHGNQDHARQQLAGRFRWGCADPHALEAWGSGLRLVESGSLADVPPDIRPCLPLSMRVIIRLVRLRPAWRNVYRINVFETAPA